MSTSFYHYMLKYRHDLKNNELALLSNAMYHDPGFPKHSIDYEELSNYFETYVSYITDMSLFDEVWELFLNEKNK